MGTFFEFGKDKVAKGEGWAALFICCARDIDSGALNPTAPTAIRLWETCAYSIWGYTTSFKIRFLKKKMFLNVNKPEP